MKSRFIERLGNRRGQAIILLALAVAGLAAFSGLAVDVANLFLKKARLQSAVDAAAIAGITSLVTKISRGSDNTGSEAAAEKSAKEVAALNIREMGLAQGDLRDLEELVNADATVDPVSREMTLKVDVTIGVNTLFIGMIGIPINSANVNARGTADRSPALISLVLDSSGSMEGQKIANLKTAATAFVNSFQDNIDQMAVVSYNERATVLQSMGVLSPAAKAAIRAKIEAIDTHIGTNIAEGLELGRLEIERVVNADKNATKNAVKAIVLMTDGTPTIIRGLWLKPKNQANGLTPNTPLGQYLYYAAAHRDAMLFPTGEIHPCGTIQSCLDDFSYLDSKGVERGKGPSGSTITDLSVLGDDSEVRKEMYDLAIVEADYAKDFKNDANPEDKGTTIYAIGLGAENAERTDPYQQASDTESLKRFFLKKVVNDPLAVQDPPFPGLASNFNPNQPEGLYLQTAIPANLKTLFLQIARRIKLKLIE